MKDLIAATIKTGSSTFLKLLFGVLSIKIIAVLLGPSGVGIFSLLRQLMQTFSVIGLGGQTAIVQGLAGKNSIDKNHYIKTTFWIFTAGSILTVGLIFIFSSALSNFMFDSTDQQAMTLVKWISLPVVLLNFYFYLKSIINGFQEIGLLALVEITGPLALLLFIYPSCLLAENGDYIWFIWLLSLMQAVMIASSLKVIFSKRWFEEIHFFSGALVHKKSWKHFKSVASTIIMTSFASVASLFIIKATISRELGIEFTGLFDLAWSVSGAYVMIILTAFGTYYLPKLSEKGVSEQGVQLIDDTLRLSIMTMAPIIIILIAVKPLLVEVLYSTEFYDSLNLLRWMLVADYFKVTSWIFAIAVIARADMKTYLFTETVWYALFALFSVLSIKYMNAIEGVAVTFLVLYVLLVSYYYWYVKKYYKYKLSYKIIFPWFAGMIVIFISSYATWNTNEVMWMTVLVTIFLTPLYIYWLMKPGERNSFRAFVKRI